MCLCVQLPCLLITDRQTECTVHWVLPKKRRKRADEQFRCCLCAFPWRWQCTKESEDFFCFGVLLLAFSVSLLILFILLLLLWASHSNSSNIIIICQTLTPRRSTLTSRTYKKSEWVNERAKHRWSNIYEWTTTTTTRIWRGWMNGIFVLQCYVGLIIGGKSAK